MLRLDLHVHTSHSEDGFCPLKDIVRMAKMRGLSGIAITDHDTIDAHREAEEFMEANFLIVRGLEVSSASGHIVGLGISDLIPPKLSAEETVERIKEQGGIAVAAHPFSAQHIKGVGVVFKAKFDAIEGINSRSLFLANPLAQRVAERKALPMIAGSDAHYCDEVGMASTILNCEANVDSVLEEIKRGETSISGQTLPLFLYLRRALHKILRKVYDSKVGRRRR